MIFVDADAYIALMVEGDASHEGALRLLSELKSEEMVTSWEVIDEVATKLSFFTSHKEAVNFLKRLFTSETRIEYVDPKRAVAVEKLFFRQSSKRVSMTDCANMVIAKELGIKRFFSFDKHYKKNGFLIGMDR